MSRPTPTPAPAPAAPEFRAAQRWNLVWVVPVLALLIGGWLVYHNYSSKGPYVQIDFETADGIIAGQTEVRCRSVRVGMVKTVDLAEDLKSVQVGIQMEPGSAHLLRAGGRFWVVKLRLSGAAVSGLTTLMQGSYIELDPGTGAPGATEFEALEEPPPTSRNVPGRRLVLKAETAGTLTVGSSVFCRGVEVGRIESQSLGADGGEVVFEAFVHDRFKHLVTSNTRFWNAGGVDITASGSGVKVRAPSLAAILSGGAAFGVPDGLEPGREVDRDGTVFKLYSDESDAQNTLYKPDSRVLLMFDQSVLGLVKGAPVRFRGITLGRVLEVSFDLAKSHTDPRIPVLVEVDSEILCRGLQEDDPADKAAIWQRAVAKGLRGSLKAESLLVPTLYVDLDCYRNMPVARVEMQNDVPVLPTTAAGFAQIEEKLGNLVAKLDALPLDSLISKLEKAVDEGSAAIANSRETLAEIDTTAAALRKIIEDPATKTIPADLHAVLGKLDKALVSVGPGGPVQGDLMRTLDELRASLRSVKSLANSIEDKPNSLIFDRDSSGNPVPRAPRAGR